jgi:Cu2+-exporting ATPase
MTTHAHNEEHQPEEAVETTHSEHHDHAEHAGHTAHEGHGGHDDHSGHEIMFRNRFWVSLIMSIPVLVYSESIQRWLGYTAPAFPGSQWIVPVFSTIIFVYGGLPFLRMSSWELRRRQPGMMTLISLAITVAYVYSMAVLVLGSGEDFFWELVTLIDVMLLGHWLEMRSVRQASGALDALAKLLPDTAEVIMPDGQVMEHPVSHLNSGDVVLVRPGASVPADGVVADGESDVNEAMITGESRLVKKSTSDNVISGTVNSGDSSLRVEVTAVGDDKALAEAAAIEGDSEHLIAQAIRHSANAQGLSLPSVEEFKILKGRGVEANVNGHTAYVGGPRMIEFLEAERPPELIDFANAAGDKGQTVVYLANGEQVVAAFALADVIRPESEEAINELHDMGVEVAMLTGDSKEVADAVARELDIDQVFAEVLPEDKDDKVIELQKQGKDVGMVGDGVNDAPALTRADVGIAIGSGTDVAVESAGLILVKSNPLDVVKILKLSDASYRKQVQNIWWSAGYNIIMIPLAMGILAPWGIVPSPALGAFLMSISTVIVAINAQTLRRVDLGTS